MESDPLSEADSFNFDFKASTHRGNLVIGDGGMLGDYTLSRTCKDLRYRFCYRFWCFQSMPMSNSVNYFHLCLRADFRLDGFAFIDRRHFVFPTRDYQCRGFYFPVGRRRRVYDDVA
jgi:hypothetical protein